MMLLPALSEVNGPQFFSVAIFSQGSALEQRATGQRVLCLYDGSLHENPDFLALMGLAEFT